MEFHTLKTESGRLVFKRTFNSAKTHSSRTITATQQYGNYANANIA